MILNLLRQPLLQFFAIGLAIFAAFAVFDDTPQTPDKPQILVSEQDAKWLASQFESTWRRPPDQMELEGLLDEYVREEIYVREALSLGLDQGDQIVRRRLRQKMEFLTEAGAEAAQLDDATLKAYFDENAEAYQTAPRIGFSQILLPDASETTVNALRAQLDGGADPAALGVRTMLPSQVPLSADVAIDNTFGQGFSDRLATLDTGVWVGPVESGFGQHLVRVEIFEPGAVPPFEQMRDRVELHWRAARAKELRLERFELMRDQYDIIRPDPANVLTQ